MGKVVFVSLGHAEYVPSDNIDGFTRLPVWNAQDNVWDLQDVWDWGDPGDWDETQWREAFEHATGLQLGEVDADRDLDPSWETVERWEFSTPDALRAVWQDLMDAVGDPPSGDDDTFDYWPSGVRLTRRVAKVLGADALTETDDLARFVIALHLGEWAEELLPNCGLDTPEEAPMLP